MFRRLLCTAGVHQSSTHIVPRTPVHSPREQLITPSVLGKFTTYPEKQFKKYFEPVLKPEFIQQLKVFNDYSLLVRKPALDIVRDIVNSRQLQLDAPGGAQQKLDTTPILKYVVPRFVVYGQPGCGISAILSQVVYFAGLDGWLIFPFTDAENWLNRCPDVTPSNEYHQRQAKSFTDKDAFDFPNRSATWLQQFLRMNNELLDKNEFVLSRDVEWTKADVARAGAPWKEVIDFALTRTKYSTDCIGILLREFRNLLRQSWFRFGPCCSGSCSANNLWLHLSIAATMTYSTETTCRETALKNLQSWLETWRDGTMEFAYPDKPTPAGGLYLTSFDPATDKPLVHCQVTTQSNLDGIVKAASIAQKEWISIGPLERGKVLHKAAEFMRQNASFAAELETLDTGKPYWEALADVQACADSIDFFAGFIPTVAGTHVPVPPNHASFYYTRREPFGVCGGIGAWNFPLQMAVWKSAPALATGNALVFKPSPLTPMTAFYLKQAYVEAGCPQHLFSIVNGEADVGQALIQHPLIAKVSFTGSVGGGQAVLGAAAKRIIPGTVELGGKSPLIIFQDADLDEAVKGTLMANFYTQGEVCSNAARVFVHRPIFDNFLQKLLVAVERLRVGDPFSPQTCMGALISPQHSESVRAYIKQAIDQGATLQTGGDQPKWPEGSPLSITNFVRPCVLTQCHDEMIAVKTEIFGPVITLLHFDSEEEVISRANNSCLGLAGGVFTGKLATAHRVAAQLQCGSVYVNSYNVYPPGIPFGGYKMSGFGRENGLETLNSYTQIKAVYVEGGKLPEPFPY